MADADKELLDAATAALGMAAAAAAAHWASCGGDCWFCKAFPFSIGSQLDDASNTATAADTMMECGNAMEAEAARRRGGTESDDPHVLQGDGTERNPFTFE